jgi:hypothetical protein
MVGALRTARGLQDCLHFGIQFPPDLRDLLIAKLSESLAPIGSRHRG